MGLLKITFIIPLIVVCNSACLFPNYYYDPGKQMVPKKPAYTLKDKPGNVVPPALDTVNVYRVVQQYKNDTLVYMEGSFRDGKYSYLHLHKSKVYLKFYPHGRCHEFSFPIKDAKGRERFIQDSLLNPNNLNAEKKYYYSTGGPFISIEGFGRGNRGKGMYFMKEMVLNAGGDTLVYACDGYKFVYAKELIPPDHRRYQVDW
jgi:hypothetical protein